MMALGLILTVIFVLDALRLRRRVCAFKTLTQSEAAANRDDYVCLIAQGQHLSDDVRSAAIDYAEREGLEVLDLLPSQWHSMGILSLAQMVDGDTFRNDRLAKGRSAGVAIILKRDVAERAQIDVDNMEVSPAELNRIATRLKLYACTTTDAVVCPNLKCTPLRLSQRRAVLTHVIGGMTIPILLGQVIIVSALLAFAIYEPLWGGIALGAFHLQPLLTLVGSPIRCWDIPIQFIARSPWEVMVSLASLFGPSGKMEEDNPLPELRKTYAAQLENGLDALFEARRETCPLCESENIFNRITTSDLVQKKPGVFKLDECPSCGHIFQNPRLSIDGLNYYYGDFYDGLGEEGLEAVFGHSADPYLKRARMVESHGDPQKWLDVGAGHGHFCCIARDVWPDCSFDALDLSESVEEAVRRRWADHGHRGLFPDMAETIEGQYDVVSMSHYLEHTREPKEELAAAHTALKDGGLIFIEVPDPECTLGRILGRWWVPWFQPQHQHLLSSSNLGDLLEMQSFEVVAWHHGEAHQEVDFLFATYLQVNRLAPPKDLPWAKPLGALGRIAHSLVWVIGTPWIALGWLMDRIMAPRMYRSKHSNTFRVLARKRAIQSD